MENRKLTPIPFSRFYDSVSNSHRALLLQEKDVTALIEDNQSFFTKVDTVFESDDLSVTRMVELVIRGNNDFLAREMFIATLNKDVRLKYIVALSSIRFDGKSQLPDKQIRVALLSGIKQHWNLDLRK